MIEKKQSVMAFPADTSLQTSVVVEPAELMGGPRKATIFTYSLLCIISSLTSYSGLVSFELQIIG